MDAWVFQQQRTPHRGGERICRAHLDLIRAPLGPMTCFASPRQSDTSQPSHPYRHILLTTLASTATEPETPDLG